MLGCCTPLNQSATINPPMSHGSSWWAVQLPQFNACDKAGVLHAVKWRDFLWNVASHSIPGLYLNILLSFTNPVLTLGSDGVLRITNPMQLIMLHTRRLEMRFSGSHMRVLLF